MAQTTTKTKLFGILGTPVSHSKSPVLQSFLAERNGVDMAYLAFDVARENLKDAFCGAKRLGAKGFNITAPHKIAIMEYLDKICPEAREINAVNTVVEKDGVWHGYNTDGDGFCDSLILGGATISGKDILIMGAGGAARPVAYKLAKKGAKSISITSRTLEKVHMIGDMVEKYTDAAFYDAADANKDYDIIINATPLGMHPYEDKNPCTFMEKIHEGVFCYDLIYNPEKTAFLKEAKARGANIINGLGMFIFQGIAAFEHFTGIPQDRKENYDAFLKYLQNLR